MERWHAKLLAILVTLVLMAIIVFIPFKIMSCFKKLGSKGTTLLTSLSCFTGGIFLGTCLLFLIPEVFQLMEESDIDVPNNIPIAEITIGSGFVFIMFLERIVYSCKQVTSKNKNKQCQTQENFEEFSINGPHENGKFIKGKSNGHIENFELNYVQVENNKCSNLEETDEETPFAESTTKTVILFLALALDEFLGGISLGLQRTQGAVWGVLIGLLAHECVIGFSYGLQLAGLSYKKRCLAYVLGVLYVVMSPLGSIVGVIIGEFSGDGNNMNFINGILQGLATGVFLYVTFFEILEGKIHSKSPYRDLLAVSAGLLLMILIALLPKESSHDVPLMEHLISGHFDQNQTMTTKER